MKRLILWPLLLLGTLGCNFNTDAMLGSPKDSYYSDSLKQGDDGCRGLNSVEFDGPSSPAQCQQPLGKVKMMSTTADGSLMVHLEPMNDGSFPKVEYVIYRKPGPSLTHQIRFDCVMKDSSTYQCSPPSDVKLSYMTGYPSSSLRVLQEMQLSNPKCSGGSVTIYNDGSGACISPHGGWKYSSVDVFFPPQLWDVNG